MNGDGGQYNKYQRNVRSREISKTVNDNADKTAAERERYSGYYDRRNKINLISVITFLSIILILFIILLIKSFTVAL